MMSISPRSSDQSTSHAPYSLLDSKQIIMTSDSKYHRDVRKSPCEGDAPESDVFVDVCDTPQKTFIMGGMARSQTLQSLSASSTSSVDSGGLLQESLSKLDENFSSFGMDLRRETRSSPNVPHFDTGLRRAIEPHLRKARLLREKARNFMKLQVHASIASSVGVPYVRLRQERPFLFDVHTHPLHEILAKTLGVHDLSTLHKQGDLKELMQPLLEREKRQPFQEAYDTYVTSFCIPLLHSIAMSQNLFHGNTTETLVSYRYQAFPRIRVMRPGDTSDGPKCGTASGHSVGCLHFHVPLTASIGTNALYTESHPGKEDWHPLIAKSVGLGFLFDGARCIHFNMENTTSSTCVALEFVIAIFGQEKPHDYVDGESLCNKSFLEDRFSLEGPGYYDEAAINIGLGSPMWQIVAKKHGKHLWDPDHRVGFPFA